MDPDAMQMTAHVNEIDANAAPDRDITAKEIEASKQIGRVLADRYPGYMWSVEVHLRGAFRGAKISLPILIGPSKGYVIPSRFLMSEGSATRAIIRAGGEILERFNVPRSGINLGMARFLDAKALTANGRRDVGLLAP
jgi:hypothetical protein